MSGVVERLTAALADRYRIERELGQGGMATVYLAEDLKHHRKVAVKVLRPELAAVIGAERFLAEISTTASLQHPHILPLFDSGSAADGPGGREFLYYVMPYVEGESLRDRLTRETQLPVADAVRIAGEVASALDYAHRRGVIHRDIKPENILLHEGQALVADFGIALAVSVAGGTRMTETGMSLGTPHYMSPEQAMGERTLDARTDLYALGCVCYEMLLGEPPFTGPTAQAIVAKVMTEKPSSIVARRDRVPAAVEEAVLTALEKLPADRFATAAAFAACLTDGPTGARHGPRGASGASSRRASSRLSRIGGLVLAATAGAIGTIALFRAFRGPVTGSETVQFSVTGSPGVAVVDIQRAAVSPDGRQVVFAGRRGDVQQLYLRGLARMEAQPIAGTTGGAEPFFSPDGAWLGFMVGDTVRKLRMDGGAPVTVAIAQEAGGGITWTGDGWIVLYADDKGPGLSRVQAEGGQVEPLTKPDSGWVHAWPAWVAEGNLILFSAFTEDKTQLRIGVLHLDTGRWELVADGIRPQSVTGLLVYAAADHSLQSVPFDFRRGRPTGPAEALGQSTPVGGKVDAGYTLSSSGTLAVSQVTPSGNRLMLITPGGGAEVIPPPASGVTKFGSPRFSPDGRHLAVSVYVGEAASVYTFDLARRTWIRVTEGPESYQVEWTDASDSVVYSIGENGLAVRAADGGGRETQIHSRLHGMLAGKFILRGSLLLTTLGGQAGRGEIVARRLGAGEAGKPWLRTPYDETDPALSPDGRWLAYTSNETGRSDVYLGSFPDAGAKVVVSDSGGAEPVWRRDGRVLYYRRPNGDIVAASVEGGSSPRITGRTVVTLSLGAFELGKIGEQPGPRDQLGPRYYVDPEGRRFVMLQTVGTPTPPSLTVTLHAVPGS